MHISVLNLLLRATHMIVVYTIGGKGIKNICSITLCKQFYMTSTMRDIKCCYLFIQNGLLRQVIHNYGIYSVAYTGHGPVWWITTCGISVSRNDSKCKDNSTFSDTILTWQGLPLSSFFMFGEQHGGDSDKREHVTFSSDIAFSKKIHHDVIPYVPAR